MTFLKPENPSCVSGKDAAGTKRYSRLKVIAFIVFIAGLYLAGYIWDITSFFTIERLKAVLESAGVFGPLIYMCMMALAVVISPIPSLPLDIAAGATFGALQGTLYSVIGGLAGAVISFLIARFLGREALERVMGGHINFCTQCSDRLLSKVVFISRLVPFISFDIVSYGAGLTKMSLKSFTVMTFLGMIPMTFIYTSFGAVLIVHKGVSIILGGCMIALFFILPRLIEKHKLPFLEKYLGHHSKSDMS
ncbi:MAG: TVP38/TMEM64 family protein [Nitrospirota bacterium]